MNNGFQWWLVIVGIGLGAGLLWLVLGRLPRQDDDVGPRERSVEAMWISQTIETGGGIAPVALVEEVLELHASYLEGPALVVGSAAPLEVQPADGSDDRMEPVEVPPAARDSVGDRPPVQRYDPRREAPEADVRQPG
jgi:hypothetical protein